ncbi:MAG: glycosyltransferase [Bacteroidia bacterium]|nr:glycosyltransferase [Bacteroidia bacterium]
MFVKPSIQFFPTAQRNSMDLFSILIPSWNNLDYLKLCIHSINSNSFYNHQLIIHINEGTDGTLEWIQQQGYSYTYSTQNAGVCYALNAMATLVQTNYILYINDDMYVCANWDEHLFKVIETKKDNLFYYSGTMIEYEDSGNKAVISPFDFGRDISTFKEAELTAFAAQINHPDWFGSCWPPSIVHKSLWEQAGGYNVAYSPGFYSDPDFAMKLWQLGVRDFRGIGASLVYHFKCRSTGRVIRNNGRKTFAKTWGIPASFLYREVLKMGLLYDPKVRLKFPTNFKFVWAKIRAFYIGLG